MRRFRIVIVGAGITGLSIARFLSMYENLDILVVEENPDVGWGVSKANTSIIHPCHEEDPGKHPVRAELCRLGHDLWIEWVRELDIPNRWPGEIITAFSDEEVSTLKKYLELAVANRIPGVRLLSGEEVLRLEPSVNKNVVAGLWAPTAGLINPMAATIALAENSYMNGVRFIFNTFVKQVVVSDHRVVGVETNKGFIGADIVVNAAGLYADELSRSAGIDYFTIHPRRGEYIVYSSRVSEKPYRIIHTAPTEKTKGVYAVTTTGGELLLGPTAEDLPRNAKKLAWTSSRGIRYLLSQAEKLLENPPPRNMIIRLFAGLRPEPSTGDFIIEFYEDPWGFVNVAGIRSPGLTAAPAIGKRVLELIGRHVELTPKNRWVRYRRGIKRMKSMSREERAKVIKKDPGYGRIICGCNMVSEAEIIEAIKRIQMIGAEITFDGVKFRTHAMCGDCQGSFCRIRIAEIISRITGKPLWAITFKGGESTYGVGEIGSLLIEEKRG